MSRWNLKSLARFVGTLTLLGVLALATANVIAQDSAAVSALTAFKSDSYGTKRALVVCGLSGDAAHHALFAETTKRLHDGLCIRLGFDPNDVQLLFGDTPLDTDSELIKRSKRATREQLERTAQALRELLQPQDSLWVIVLGHSHFMNQLSWLNLSGPDIHQNDFGKLFEGLACQQQVFVITTPTSGFYIKPLSTPGRVVFTATEQDSETNETLFPHEFAKVLGTPSSAKEFDLDEDGQITLFDLYLNTARNVAQSYFDQKLLATEHPLLDDNGDGRGTEIQVYYFPEDLGGLVKFGRRRNTPSPTTTEGVFARTIPIPTGQSVP